MKKFIYVSFPLFLCLNSSFAQHIDTTQYVIIDFDSVGYYHVKFPAHSVRATLTDKETFETMRLLDLAVKEFNNEERKGIRQLINEHPENKSDSNQLFNLNLISIEDYKLQLITALTPEHEKIVWVNCLCDFEIEDWQKQPVEVLDGGKCFFNVKINLTRKQYYDFRVNGKA